MEFDAVKLARMEERQISHYAKMETLVEEMIELKGSHYRLRDKVNAMESTRNGVKWILGIFGAMLTVVIGAVVTLFGAK